MQSISVSSTSFLAVDLFQDLGEDLRAELASKCQGQAYDVDEMILCRGDEQKDVYFILSGAVHITNFSVNGKEVTFRDQLAGEAFGLLSAIDQQPRSAIAISRGATSIARMDGKKFCDVLRDHAVINERVMNYLTALVRALSDRVIEFSTLNVNQRIYAELLRLSGCSGAPNRIPEISPVPTHADLASRVATHREAVSRELKQLRDKGIIEKCGDKLIIKDFEQLEALITQSMSQGK